MKLFVVNGLAGSGKDTFMDAVIDYSNFYSEKNTKCIGIKTSVIDPIKSMIYQLGLFNNRTTEVIEKSEKYRSLLFNLKEVITDWDNDFLINNMIKKIKGDPVHDFIFVCIREKSDIDSLQKHFPDLKILKVLIKNDNIKQITSNRADANVFNMDYDIVIDNSGSMDTLMLKAIQFYFNHVLSGGEEVANCKKDGIET